jgi:hypothetical protein
MINVYLQRPRHQRVRGLYDNFVRSERPPDVRTEFPKDQIEVCFVNSNRVGSKSN